MKHGGMPVTDFELSGSLPGAANGRARRHGGGVRSLPDTPRSQPQSAGAPDKTDRRDVDNARPRENMGMKATKFRVRNFRNIEDSGWVALDRLTAFVGRNESGKSSLLKALHKFNPAKPERYDAQREFPRDRYMRDYLAGGANGGDWPVCSVEFEIPAEIQENIARLLDPVRNPPAIAIATRYFDGSLSLSYRPHIEESALAPDPAVDALRRFVSAIPTSKAAAGPQPTANREPAPENPAGELSDWAIGWAKALADVGDLRCERGADLLKGLCREAIERRTPETDSIIRALVSAVEPILRAASRGSAVERIDRLIERSLPVFIYFENYGVLDSTVSLPQFLRDRENDPFDPRIRTIDALFEHVALDPAEIADLEEQRAAPIPPHGGAAPDRSFTERAWQRKEERAIKLSAASLDISRGFSAWWSQRRHRIRYHADGDYFRVWVADDRLTDVEIELELRSKGFQWFFSFYLVFLVESDAGHKSAILLLDEPGLHLHPTAQQELVAFLARLSEQNQLVYTTHSPFLIDGERPSCVWTVVEDDTGHSKVAGDAGPLDSEAVFPIRAASALAAMKELCLDRSCVLVEGWSEFYYLHLLSRQCAASGRPALPEDVRVVPCGGPDGARCFSSLSPAQDRGPLVLLESGGTGRKGEDRPLPSPDTVTGRHAVLLDRAIGRPGSGAEFEDILGKAPILEGLASVLGKSLPAREVDEGGAGLTQRIEAAAKRHDFDLPADWRIAVAQHLASTWAEREPLLDEDTLDAAASLFSALVAASAGADGDTGRIEDAPDEAADGDAKDVVMDGGGAPAPVRADAAKEDAESVDVTIPELTEEDRNMLEMIARMSDEAEAGEGADAGEDPGEEGVLARIADSESREGAEPEDGGILDRVAEREREEREADRALPQG